MPCSMRKRRVAFSSGNADIWDADDEQGQQIQASVLSGFWF